jgi:hypothetical protein
MRVRFAGVPRAVFAAAVVSLVVVDSAAAVAITGVNPLFGAAQAPADGSLCPGANVAISGSGFVSDGPAASVSVSFNGTKSPFVQVGSDITVYAVVPPAATSGPITVTTAAGTATSGATFTVIPCMYTSESNASHSVPAIKGFKPASGKVGTAVTIKGTSLTGATKVTFAGVNAKFKHDSPTQLTATVPKNAKSGKISVSNPAGTSRTTVGFKVTK